MISVLPGGKVVVKAPEGMPMRVIKAFLRDHADWITEKKAFMSLVPPRPQIEIKEGGKLWLAGVQFPLHFVDEGCDTSTSIRMSVLQWRTAYDRKV